MTINTTDDPRKRLEAIRDGLGGGWLSASEARQQIESILPLLPPTTVNQDLLDNLRGLVSAVRAEADERGASEFLLARLSDARDAIAREEKL